MTVRTHVQTVNATDRMYLVDSVKPYRNQICHVLGLMDGGRRWSYSLARAPSEKKFSELDFGRDLPQFMQSAGTAEAMTIEVKFMEDDGVGRQYVVGRPGGDYTGEPPVTLKYLNDTRELHLYPNEVFEKEEAADIYYQYFLTDRVPEPYVLRRMDFSAYEKAS